MKTFLSTCFAAALVLLTSTSFAAVWRVNNNVTSPSVSTDFNNLQSAISSGLVSAGDTLYVEGSATSYGNIDVNKPLTIIGAGYFLADNDTTQAFQQSSNIGRLQVSATAAGTVLTGLRVRWDSWPSNSFEGAVTILANDVVVDRCYIENTTFDVGRGRALTIANNLTGVIVRRCFLYRNTSSTSGSNCSVRRVIEIGQGVLNFIVENNIIKHGNNGFATNACGDAAFTMGDQSSGVIRNNVFNGNVIVNNSLYNNNIQIAGTYTSNATMVSEANNIGHSTQYGTANGNQSNVNMTDVFEYGPGSQLVDNHYVLKAGSPAIGAGVSGVDCGACGGLYPYYLSGLPAIPAVFEVVLGSNIVTSSSGLQLNTKSKAHD